MSSGYLIRVWNPHNSKNAVIEKETVNILSWVQHRNTVATQYSTARQTI